MKIRQLVLLTTAPLLLFSCVSSKKFKTAKADYEKLEAKYTIAESDLAECATEKATLARQKETLETILDEAIEEAINLLELEPEEEETTIPIAKVKEQLKKQIAYVVDEKQKPEEAKPYQEAEKKILDTEKERY